MNNWQPIKTAPEDGTRVLAGRPTDGSHILNVATAEFTNGRWIVSPTAWDGDGDTGGLADLDFEPTHWLPLPQPPTD